MWKPAKLLTAVASALAAAPALAQCTEQWLPMGRLIGGIGAVNAAAAWDPDGPGPTPEALVVGGDFYLAGGKPVSNLAVWDGQSWSDFAGGFDRAVTGVAVLHGDLYVSYSAGAWNRLMRWNGQSWDEVAAESGPILGVHEGELIAERYSAGTSAWNGTTWRPLGNPCGAQVIASHNGELAAAVVDHWNGCVAITGGGAWSVITGNLGGFPQFGWAYAMGSGPDGLYLSGQFGVGSSYGIARWDGSQWNEVGSGGFVRDFHTFGGQFYAAGAVSGTGPVARLDGSEWHPIASEIGGPGSVRVLCTYAGQLVAAGQFTSIDGTPASSIARWDGSAWHGLGSGVDLSERGSGQPGIFALASAGADLYIGGFFQRVGALPCGSIARFNGASWDNLQGGLASGAVETMLFHNGELIIGGHFSSVGGVAANNIAAWNGSQWRPLGAGLGIDLNSAVWALGVYRGELYAAGRRLEPTGHGLMRWDGQAWQIVPTPGTDDVEALATFNDELYVGSSFTVAGGGRGLARWDGAGWLPVGFPGEYIYAHRLAVYNGEVIVGTNTATFHQGIIRWNGQAWGTMGSLNSGRVKAMTVRDGELIVAGGFTAVGNVPASKIAAWNGAQWRGFGAGLQGNESYLEARALAPYGSGFAVGGEFRSAGGQLSPHLALWGTGAPACYANCDCSPTAPTLNVADFTCFLQRFAAGDMYANCDQSTTSPVLNISDFTCFLQRFAAGCS